MINFKPFKEDFGSISVLYEEIGFMIQAVGLYVGCNNTYTTLQFYDCEEKLMRAEKPWGAVQYERNNTLINLRFYRSNVPQALREKLENIVNEYRQDTNDVKCNTRALSIAFKFSSLEKGVHSFLLSLFEIIQEELTNLEKC